MIYYLITPGETLDVISDYNTLGESSFKNFWTAGAWKRLTYYAENQPTILEKLKVKTSDATIITLDEFVKSIKPLHIIQ